MPKSNGTQSRSKITITQQPISDSLESILIHAVKKHFGRKFNEKVFLSLVDLYKPLYLAINGGDEQTVIEAIEQSRREMNDCYKYALNQIPPGKRTNIDSVQSPTEPVAEINNHPPANLSTMEWPEGEDPPMEF